MTRTRNHDHRLLPRFVWPAMLLGFAASCAVPVDVGDLVAEAGGTSEQTTGQTTAESAGTTTAESAGTTTAESAGTTTPSTTGMGGGSPQDAVDPADLRTVAMLNADLPPEEQWSQVPSDALIVRITNRPDTCSLFNPPPGCNDFLIEFALPVDAQAAGTTLDLSTIEGSFRQSGSPRTAPDDCWFGSGSADGQLQITRFDGTLEGVITDLAGVELTSDALPFSTEVCS